MEKPLWIVALSLLYSIAALAAPLTEDRERIRSFADAFIQQQIAGLPGKITYRVEELDKHLAMPPCSKLEAFLPAGNQLIGTTSVGIRCIAGKNWTLYVPAQIRRNIDLVVSARQLPPGHTLQPADLATRSIETTQVDGLTDPALALGKVLRLGISAGQTIHEEMLRPPFSITQGQTVQLRAQGVSFNIHGEGKSLNNASDGQPVQIRTASGRVIGGIAKAGGIVEIGL
jgi:flagella basal body P-ring formation protein FlgA